MKIISTEKDLVENYKFLKESAYKSKVSNAYDGLIQNAPITLKEGLITTYPATRVVAAIKDHFKLSLTQEEICFAKIIFNQKLESNGEISLSTGNNGEELIVITLSKESGRQLWETIRNKIKTYKDLDRWFNISSNREKYENDVKEYQERLKKVKNYIKQIII